MLTSPGHATRPRVGSYGAPGLLDMQRATDCMLIRVGRRGISNLPEIQETASLARDPCLQQSASSDPPQITRGIITPESPHPTAFSHSQGLELTQPVAAREEAIPPKPAAPAGRSQGCNGPGASVIVTQQMTSASTGDASAQKPTKMGDTKSDFFGREALLAPFACAEG